MLIGTIVRIGAALAGCVVFGCGDDAPRTLVVTSTISGSHASLQPRRTLTPGADAIRSASADSIPELPRAYVDVSFPVVTGRSVAVRAGADLQAALDAAQPGDELVLQAGATFTGPFTLPLKTGAGWITIRSAGTLPPQGTRVTPAAAPQMARLVSRYPAEPVIATAPGAHHYRLVGLEITALAGATLAYTLVELGRGDARQTSLVQVPSDLVLDRVYVHGTPTLSFQRCVGLNSARTAIVDSYLAECHGKGFDSQAIGGWNGPGPYKIVNNYLEGAGENVMFGGADPSIPGLTPSDIEVRRNHITKPLAWKGVWSVKNLFELKHAQRVLVEGNVLENNWADAQSGFAVLFQALSDNNTAAWTRVWDVTFRHNIVRNSPAGINVLSRVAYGPNGVMPAEPSQRIWFYNNLLTEIGTDASLGSSGRLFQLLGDLEHVRLEHNTGFATHSAITFDAAPGAVQRGLVVINNVFGRGTYGFFGSGAGEGQSALDRYAPDARVTGNVLIGGSAARYPPLNRFSPTAAATFVNPMAGDYRLRTRLKGRAPATGPGVDMKSLSEVGGNIIGTR